MRPARLSPVLLLGPLLTSCAESEPAASEPALLAAEEGCAPMGTCAFGGATYRVGDTFHDALRCNACACTKDGVVCTARFCDPAEACTLGDQQFARGTTVVCEDGCNQCQCNEDGWSTTLALCAPLDRIELCDDPPQGVVDVDVLYRSGDALALELGSGGCATDRPPVKLCWDGSFAESFPVQVRLRAVPTEVTSCSAWVTRQEVFDLAPLREAFARSYPGQPGRMRIGLDGSEILYTF